MSNAHYIGFPRIEGLASRQAHADLPERTFERELGKEGFFGPATHWYISSGWAMRVSVFRRPGNSPPSSFSFLQITSVTLRWSDKPLLWPVPQVLHHKSNKPRR